MIRHAASGKPGWRCQLLRAVSASGIDSRVCPRACGRCRQSGFKDLPWNFLESTIAFDAPSERLAISDTVLRSCQELFV